MADHHIVKVRLISHGKMGSDDRAFRLSKSTKSIKFCQNSESLIKHAKPYNLWSVSKLLHCLSPIMSRYHAKFVFGSKENPPKIVVYEGSVHGTVVSTMRLNEGGEMVLQDKSKTDVRNEGSPTVDVSIFPVRWYTMG